MKRFIVGAIVFKRGLMKAIMLVVVLLPTCLWSQELGDYVRVQAGEKTFKGTIKKMSARYMLLRTIRKKVVVRIEQIDSIEKRIARQSRWGKYARYGSIAGAMLGIWFVEATKDDSLLGPYSGGQSLGIVAVSSFYGALAGSLVGLLHVKETWMPVEKPYKTTRLHITPAGVRVSLHFW